MTAPRSGNGPPPPPKPAKIPGKESLRPELPRRFYKGAHVGPCSGGGFVIHLDGRPIKTPRKRPLALPTEALAAAVADEWSGQGDRIDPATMPLTKLANTTIDAVSDESAAVAADVVRFAGSDLLCYRAEHPQELVERQAAAWDPVLGWAHRAFDAQLEATSGIVFRAQAPSALAAVERAVSALDPWRLTGLHVVTTLTGSAVLGLALLHGRLTAAEVWAAAHVDEDWQVSQWGEDAEASARRAVRWQEMQATHRFLMLLGTSR